MRLTFSDNKFVIHSFTTEQGRELADTSYTFAILNGQPIFHTRNAKSAARFRHVADSKAENVFKLDLLKTYAVPSGGLLSPKELTLLKFQAERGIPFILGGNRRYVAHQPGLGKSAQFICAVATKGGRATIIVPSFLRTNWAREITKWFHNDFPTIAQIPNPYLDGPIDCDALNGKYVGVDFLIVSSAMLQKKWVREVLARRLADRRHRWLGIDEAHQFKTYDSIRTVALFGGMTEGIQAPGLIYNTEHVVFMSGTPMLNRPIELWTVLRAAAPETIDFMDYEEFGHAFCGPTRDKRGHVQFLGSHNEDELKRRMQPAFMQRIRKEDVLPDLPKKIRRVLVIDKDTRKADAKELDRKLLRDFDNGFEKPEERGEQAALRHINGLAKVPWAAQYIDSILSSDDTEQIILYGYHRDVIEDLAHRLKKYKPRVIYGGVDSRTRTEIEDEFQSGRCKLIVGNLNAMGVGLNLPAATRVTFCEFDWTFTNNEQAEDRANRLTSLWSIFCEYIAIPGSIDEAIISSNIVKQERERKVIG